MSTGWTHMTDAELLAEARARRDRLIDRMVELKRRGAPREMRTRLELDLKDVLDEINDLNERIHLRRRQGKA